jgi:hypothetical protein
MARRGRALVLVIAVVGFAGWLDWRWQGQLVDVVIVNASGTPAEFSWQPGLFAETATIPVAGCEAKSVELVAGASWRFVSDSLDVNSSSVNAPPFTRQVAVEIWLAPDGSSRLVSAHPIDRPIDAPYPSGCAAQPE